MKALKILATLLLATTLVVVAALIVGIPAGFIADAIGTRVARETGYRLTVAGNTKFTLGPLPVLEMHDITFEDTKGRPMRVGMTIDTVRADISLRSLLSGAPRLRELTITRPVVTLPLLRERLPRTDTASDPINSTAADRPAAFPIDHITVNDGAVIFKSDSDPTESRIDAINLQALSGPEGRLSVTGDGKSGDRSLKLDVTATIPLGPINGVTIPVDVKFAAPGFLSQPLSATSEVKFNGPIVTLNGLTGLLGTAKFSGYASFDLASKPLVKMNLDFQRLDLEAPAAISTLPAESRSTSGQPGAAGRSLTANSWTGDLIDLNQLNFIDAQIRLSVATLNVGTIRLAPAQIESSLASGVLKMTLSNLGLYEGRAAAGLAVDASIPTPIYALRAELRDVRALPLLTDAADFTLLDGKMQATLDVRSTGRNQRELVSNLSGTATAGIGDGEIRGINVAKMIRTLTSTTILGWQEDQTQKTDFAQLSASFRIDKGQAATEDLKLFGPLARVTGTGVINMPTRSIDFRVEPKLVLTTQGQGGPANPVGLGIPVLINGPWTEPRIYPDVAGILDNPGAAFSRLRELGQGLFGNLPAQPDSAQPNAESADKPLGRFMDGLGPLIQGLGRQGPDGQGSEGADASQAGGSGTAAPSAPVSPPAPTGPFPIDQIIRNIFGK